jgi:hypothetical protein
MLKQTGYSSFQRDGRQRFARRAGADRFLVMFRATPLNGGDR